MSTFQIIPGKSMAAVVRAFALTPEGVAERVAMTMNLLEQICTLGVAHRVQVMIPSNRAFADCDCGLTRQALVSALHGKPWAGKVAVTASTRGDPSGTMLNYAVERIATDWVWILSPESVDILRNRDVLEEISVKSKAGASVIGVQFSDLEEITGIGIISNRCAFWQRIPLMEAGGFLSMSEFTLIGRAQRVFQDKREITGAEEGLTILRMLHANSGVRTAILGPIQYQISGEPGSHNRLVRLSGSKLCRVSTMVRELGGSMETFRAICIQ